MRKLRFTLLTILAMGAFTFTSCDKDDEPNLDLAPEKGVVTFEAAQLSTEGYLVNSTYIEKGITFKHDYTVSEYGDYWNGFAISNKNDKTTAGYENMYSVYGGGGADNSAKFGVSFVSGTSEFTFAGTSERVIEYAYVNNATYAYLAIKHGDDGNEFPFVKGPFEKGDWFKLTITGYDAAGKKTGEKEVYLADFRDDEDSEPQTFIMEEWTKVELDGLGKVNKVKFALSSTDVGQYGMNTPGVFCIDNISYVTALSAN